jgi:outer membrane protein TolC
LAKAVADRENLLRGVELEVWTAYSQVIEAGQAIQAAEKLVASAEESARVAEGEYKSGTGSIIGLIDAQTARTSARTSLIQARLDWYTALAQFERAVGRTLASDRYALSDGRTAP